MILKHALLSSVSPQVGAFRELAAKQARDLAEKRATEKKWTTSQVTITTQTKDNAK